MRTDCSKAFRDSYHPRHHESGHTGIKLVSWSKKTPTTWFPASPPSPGTAAELRWSLPLLASYQQSLRLPRAPTPAAVPGAQLWPWPRPSRNPVSLSRTMPARCVGRPSGMCTTSTGTGSPIRTKSPSSVLFAIALQEKGPMTSHVRSHEGGSTKPHTGSVCGKGFSRRALLPWPPKTDCGHTRGATKARYGVTSVGSF